MHMKTKEQALKEFWENVSVKGADDCWEWQGYRDAKGYGRMSFNRNVRIANRVAWGIMNGDIKKGICILHKCDNPPCCNPAHLFLGTRSDNAKDRHKKGRTKTGVHFGSVNPNSILIEDDVIKIRKLATEGMKQKDIAIKFNVSIHSISSIVRNVSWTHI
jgi:hypothetical protein